MKRIVVLSFLVLLAAVGSASAQRCLPGQLSLEIAGGSVDGVILQNERSAYRFFGRLALNRYNRNKTQWLFALTYLQKDYAYNTVILPMAQITAEAGYFIPLFSDRKRNLIFSAGLSAAAGYETTG